jgi:hypothetical protein
VAGLLSESKANFLDGLVRLTVNAADQICRGYTNSDHGIDLEIEFRNKNKEASGARVYLQLKMGHSHLRVRKRGGKEIIHGLKPRHLNYWKRQKYPVFLVVGASPEQIRWMNITEYLRQNDAILEGVEFKGVEFSVQSILNIREAILAGH